MSNVTVATITLGCRLNQTETATICGILRDAGYKIIEYTKNNKDISIIIVNTCALTYSASQKSRQTINSVKKNHPKSRLIITGCDLIENNIAEYKKIAEIIVNKNKTENNKYINSENKLSNNKTCQSFFKENSTGYYPFKTRANIKIQDGCDSYCPYCIVPYCRGKPRYREWKNIIAEFKNLIMMSHKEIILTGVNISKYNYKNKTLPNLIEELCNIGGIFRIRLSSIEFDVKQLREIINLMKNNDKICKFLHISIQSGTNKILKNMGRNYSIKTFNEFLLDSKKEIPELCFGSDLIVGFPGETENDFKKCTNFIEKSDISYLNVFRYSKRNGTPASLYSNQIDNNIINNRYKIMNSISRKLSEKFLNSNLNNINNILYEKIVDNYAIGFSNNYIKVSSHINNNNSDDKKIINNIIKTELIKISGYRKMLGNIII